MLVSMRIKPLISLSVVIKLFSLPIDDYSQLVTIVKITNLSSSFSHINKLILSFIFKATHTLSPLINIIIILCLSEYWVSFKIISFFFLLFCFLDFALSFGPTPFFILLLGPHMDEGRDFALTQMRNSVQKLSSSAEGYEEPTLMRFMIARSMEADKAAKMFVQWQKWRAGMVPNGFITESEVADELETRKVFLQGLSQDKYPVMLVQTKKHFPANDQIQFKKFVVYLLDKTIGSAFKGREIGNEKLIGVIDLQNISYRNIDTRALITGFQFLQAYYPDRLSKCYILHMPWFFRSVWRLVSRFLEKATLEKIVIVNNEDERREFIREVGEEVLPEEYGGRAKLVAIQDVEMTPLQN